MSTRDRNEHGQFADRVDPESVREVFDARTDPCEPLDAGDVADELGIARRTALKKLDELSDQGILADKKVGARARVWWIPANSIDAITDRTNAGGGSDTGEWDSDTDDTTKSDG